MKYVHCFLLGCRVSVTNTGSLSNHVHCLFSSDDNKLRTLVYWKVRKIFLLKSVQVMVHLHIFQRSLYSFSTAQTEKKLGKTKLVVW